MKASEALGSRAVAGGTSRAQYAVVIAEIVLAVVLLVGASAMVQSFGEASGRNRGYEPSGLRALNVSLPFTDDSFESTERRTVAFDDMLARVAMVPGVRAAGATTGFPGSPLGILGGAPISPPGSQAPTMAALHAASAGYFDTMRIPIKAGRAFTAADSTHAPGVALVNELLAAQFPNGNPIGERISLSFFGNPATTFEIVGVAGNIRLKDQVGARIFVPLAQVSPYWIDLVYREEPGSTTMPAVRQTLRGISNELLIENESSFQSIISNSLALERIQSIFAAMVGVLSTLVAGIGLYALMTFLTTQRRREFGIRLALGSPPRHLFGGALSRAMRLALLGLALGTLAASLLVQTLRTYVFGLAAVGISAYLTAGIVVLAVSVAAAWIPARRVMRTDPLLALRAD
jgi:ABC-type antimicrobial peptide transport system permease subunit